MLMLPRPPTALLAVLTLATAAAHAAPPTVQRAQLEPLASILLRDVAAEVCIDTPRAGAAALSPAAQGRLQAAGEVFKSLGYPQGTGTGDLDAQLRNLPTGAPCRAQALSNLWQHFRSRGRQTAGPLADAEAATDLVALNNVDSLPRMPGATAGRSETPPETAAPSQPPARRSTPTVASPATTDAAPAKAAGAAAPEAHTAASGVPASAQLAHRNEAADGPSIAPGRREANTPSPAPPVLPATSPPASEVAALPRGADPAGPGGRGGAVGAAAAAVPPAPTVTQAPPAADRMAPIERLWPWLGAALVLVLAGFWRFRSRRAGKPTSAQLARARLRPS